MERAATTMARETGCAESRLSRKERREQAPVKRLGG